MILTTEQPQDWKDLQNKVANILRQCGFKVETEKTAETARGKIELDVYAEEVIKGRKYSIACECKNWKSNIPQNVIHGFRTAINDLGCNIGYVITTSDFQSGSVNTAKYTNIELLTWDNFLTTFFESWYESYFSPQITERLNPILTFCEPILPNWFIKMSDEDKKAYLVLKDKYDVFSLIIMSFTRYARIATKYTMPTLPIFDRVKDSKQIMDRVPIEILKETGYKEFLEKCSKFGDIAISEFRYFRAKYNETKSNE